MGNHFHLLVETPEPNLVTGMKWMKNDGWVETRTKGSHHQFKHPKKPGVVTVPHPKKDLPVGTARAILK